MFPFSSDSIAYDPVKTMLWQAEAEEPTNHDACSHTIRLAFDTKRVLATPTIQFSLDHKRRSDKRNRHLIQTLSV